MADAVHNPEQEFWRAPLPLPAEVPASVLEETCCQCGTEFLMGAAFCHKCGASREVNSAASFSSISWKKYFSWLRHLEFHAVQEGLGLPTASLVAFVIGVGCLICAIAVGFVFSANTILDWQAVQLWRIEWLLGAAAAFLAGLLLKRATSR